jgi:hypothetical protein
VATEEEGGDNELNDEGVGEGSGACLGGHEELRRSAAVGDRLQKKGTHRSLGSTEKIASGVSLMAASNSTQPENGADSYGPKMTRTALVQAAAVDTARPLAVGD